MNQLRIVAGALALAIAGAASAQDPQPQAANPAAASSPHQRQVMEDAPGRPAEAVDPATFVAKAAQGGMTEVELAKLALQKSSQSDVKAFATRMLTDHGKANDELKVVAKRNDLKVPPSLDARHKAIVDGFRGKSGTDFDTAYAQQMVKDHHETIALFEGAAQSGNADIAAFSRKTLPTLKQHDDMAQELPARQ